jgi:hypothetical protein
MRRLLAVTRRMLRSEDDARATRQDAFQAFRGSAASRAAHLDLAHGS